MSVRTLVIGAGNELRRDDGAGLAAARRLRSAGLEALEAGNDLALLARLWEGRDRVMIIDAVRTGGDAGTLHRFDAAAGPLPAIFDRSSTHGFGVGEAIELARVLGRLPASLVLYGIEGADFGPGEGLSPEVEQAVQAVAARNEEEHLLA